MYFTFSTKKSPHIWTNFEPWQIIRPPHSESQKKDRWGPLFASLFSQDPLCLLFTARPGSSQDSQETHVATNRCTACKHRPSLTRVYANNSYRLLLCPCPSLTRMHARTHTSKSAANAHITTDSSLTTTVTKGAGRFGDVGSFLRSKTKPVQRYWAVASVCLQLCKNPLCFNSC